MSQPVCHAITRRSASNLALAFVLLPGPQRAAMSSLYAFCREVDDVADEDARPVADRRQALAAWRTDIQRACDGLPPEFPVNRELQPAIRQYGLPFELFDEILLGCESDLETLRHDDWPQLEQYCLRVASAVGLLSIRIFGARHPAAPDYAIALGLAFQLTNILRDVRDDAARGRIYLPAVEMDRHGVSAADLFAGRYSPRYRDLAAAVAARARAHYRRAAELLPVADRRAMIAAELMGAVYWRLLRQLEARGFEVFSLDRVRVPKPVKVGLVLRTWWRIRVGPFAPNYGVP